MPATSKAQFRWLHTDDAKKALGKKGQEEWLGATGSPKNLPEKKTEERNSHHRAMFHLRKGGLHKHLGVPEGENIPDDKMEIKESDSEHVRKMKQFALNARKFKHP